jgi:dihydroorotate dehydrogenase (NAD+) catalytic subunit
LELKNPVVTASGTFGCGREYSAFFDLGKLGALVVKSLTLEERPGNPMPRICETPSGILNSIGLQNKGVDRFLEEDLPCLEEYDVPVIANVAGESVEEYVQVCHRLDVERNIAGIELNISCPNVEEGCMLFGQEAKAAASLVRKCRAATGKPLIVKLTPNVSDIGLIAQKVEEAGADAISLINTIMGMRINIDTYKSLLATPTGGLSGPAIRPVAVRMVWEVAKSVKIPIIGMGGITNAEDAVEFLLVGATAVAVGTANFMEPTSALRIIEGLSSYLEERGIDSIKEIIGRAKV